jgi:hypothetical protein
MTTVVNTPTRAAAIVKGTNRKLSDRAHWKFISPPGSTFTKNRQLHFTMQSRRYT